MAIIRNPAIICSMRAHGENGAVVRLLTRDHGLQAGYAAGAKSRTSRPVLLPGNLVSAELRQWREGQLASLTVELVQSRGPWFGEPLCAAAIDWACLASASILAEGEVVTRCYTALSALLEMICAAPSARWWAGAMVHYELLLLDELGLGLDLTQCAKTGRTDQLRFISPRTGRAVSADAAAGLEDKLLDLPQFLLANGPDEPADWQQIMQGLHISGYFLDRGFINQQRTDMGAVRSRLLERLGRIANAEET